MKVLVSQITIGDFVFNYVTNVEIESSWDIFTDTAIITLPNKFRLDNKDIVVGDNNVFNRGDAVTIGIGYFSNITKIFEGFISRIKPDSPLIIECEDQMYLLKQRNLASRSFISATIKEVVDYAAVGETIEFDDPTAKIGDFHIDNKNFINSVEVFDVLKKQFGYHIYYQDKKLQVRALNSVLALSGKVHVVSFQNNVISSDLEYRREDDLNIVIKAESISPDNKRIILYGFKESGNTVVRTLRKEGETRSLKYYDLTQAELKQQIERVIDNFIFEGYSGAFETFLEPPVRHSDRMELEDLKHQEREGRYLIKSVITRFGIDGGRQVISLQNRIL